ncbi:MAG: YtxH domain-containing protein [Candidatus Omnitrophica bacterium]|nr:YtxH domain-containing protein [Candidatus Omnitrophota bacterium]
MAIIMRHQRFLGRTVGAFALGAVAGSVLALLCAPASGRITRRRIGLKVKALQSTAARRLQWTRSQLVKQARQLRAVAAEKVGETREWVMDRLPLANGNGRHSANHRTTHSA